MYLFLPPFPKLIKLSQQFILGRYKSNREGDFNICFINGWWLPTVLAEICLEWWYYGFSQQRNLGSSVLGSGWQNLLSEEVLYIDICNKFGA